MCGIVGFAGRKKAVPYLLDCLERLEYRGYDSAGIALSEEKEIEVEKCKGKLSVLTSVLCSKKQSDSTCGIGHTRWATHGKPDKTNAHPHLSENGIFAVVHNGIIENYATLKKELQSCGVSFRSQTDTEVISQLLEKNYDGDFLSAVKKTLVRLEGSYAVAILCKDYPDRIFCSRWGSPIVLCSNSDGNFISSDVTSLLKYSKDIFRLEGGESAMVSAQGIEFFSKSMDKIEKHSERIEWSVTDAEKNGYSHFMLKEIFEQPEAVKNTLESFIRKDGAVFDDSFFSDEQIRKIRRILFIGCGSAYHAGLAGKYVTEELTGILTDAEIASEWRYGSSPVDESCLAVFISQSGETADTLAALRKAKEKGAKILSIVNVVSSSVASESDCVLYTRAGPEIAVATTKAYSAQLVTVFLLAIKISQILGKTDEKHVQSLIGSLLEIPQKLSATLTKAEEIIKHLADELFTSDYIYFIGRNTDYAAAKEGALKLREVSYIPCEAYAAGELKHGTISLVEKGTPVVALMGNGRLFSKTLSNVTEVRSRGARTIGIGSFKEGDRLISDFYKVIETPDTADIFSAVYEGAVLQLFAFYTGLRIGCDIDKPRNLAKSVTVE